MSDAAKRKAAIDCTGEIVEAATNVPLLIINDAITDDEWIDDYNAMKARWAHEYRELKERLDPPIITCPEDDD